MTRSRVAARLVAAVLAAFLGLSYPLLALFNVPADVLGVPLLYAYLFVGWAALIVVVRAILRKGD
jgi:hypothetical protein